MDTQKLQSLLRDFAAARDWDQFHSPKNLVMALSVECSELVEEFQWLTEQQSRDVMGDTEQAQRIRDEMADITAYLLMLASKLNIDLEQAVQQKIDKNGQKYPADQFKGSATKYNR